ncbi:MAG: ATP-binding protein [Archaeoglobaceae archaeon]
MRLWNWWEVAKPHKDIVEGKMSQAIFAADLGDVVYGKAPLEYRDARMFFQRTYLTNGLKKLIMNVLSRLNDGKGDPVIQIQTPFGGGKTHSLLALYHIVKNWEELKHLDFVSELQTPPKNAKVAVFVGTHADAIKGRTPWGEIAYQLGRYEVVKEHDEKRRSPGKDKIHEILGNDPVLILIDELVEYAVKAKDFEDQIYAFSQELAETVKAKENCCLVCTLPSSTPYGETGERALNQLQKIYGRVEAVYTPVDEEVEIYEVVRKRLFDYIGGEKVRKEVAQWFFELYQRLGEDVPKEVREIAYRDKIERAYPFHPELIDVLYKQWGSYPNFQRTRGVLRLLASIIADIYKRRVLSPLIQSSLVNLGNPDIRGEFVKHIGNEYESVIAADIAGRDAKAPRIDKEMGSEYEKYGIASGIATSIFLYSFSGAGKKGVTLPRIRVAVLREGIPHTIVGDAIEKLEGELYYLHSEKKEYTFKTQPNLNKIIVDREGVIPKERVPEELKKHLQQIAGKAFEVYLWPENASDVPDNKNLKLAILSPDFLYGFEKTEKLVKEFFDFRVYRNSLVVIAMQKDQSDALFASIKRFLALSDIQSSKSLMETITKEAREELKKKLEEVKREIPNRILNAYRHLALLEGDGLKWRDLGIVATGTIASISERVKQYLKDQEKILSRLTPKYIVEKTLGSEGERTLQEIYELFLKTPGMPILENERVLISAVKEGVKNGLLGLRKDEKIYYRQDVEPTSDSIVLRGEIAERIVKERKPEIEEKIKEEKEVKGEVEITGKDKRPEREEEKKKVKRFTLEAEIPWEDVYSAIRGVIIPLKEKSSSIKIYVKVIAESNEGFDKLTLESKVRETLLQINAKILDWREEQSR